MATGSIRSLCPRYARVIGLTGGIGSGKSHARKFLESLGAVTIDCDSLAHRAYLPGTRGIERLRDIAGDSIFDAAGFVDRRALGAKLFNDPSIRARVEAALWPEVLALTIENLNAAATPGSFELRVPNGPSVQVPRGIAVIEAALLIEAGWHTRVDELWVTHVPEATAVTRIVERNHIPPEDARRRIQAQMTNKERLVHASFAVDTSGPIEETRQKLAEPWTRIVREVAEER